MRKKLYVLLVLVAMLVTASLTPFGVAQAQECVTLVTDSVVEVEVCEALTLEIWYAGNYAIVAYGVWSQSVPVAAAIRMTSDEVLIQFEDGLLHFDLNLTEEYVGITSHNYQEDPGFVVVAENDHSHYFCSVTISRPDPQAPSWEVVVDPRGWPEDGQVCWGASMGRAAAAAIGEAIWDDWLIPATDGIPTAETAP